MLIDIFSTVVNPEPTNFSHVLNSHNKESEEKWGDRLKGFLQNFIDNNRKTWTETHQQIVNHMLRTKHHFSMEVDEKDLYSFAKWGWNNHCIIITPNSTICDPSGSVLINPDNKKQDDNAQLPLTEVSIQRRLKTVLSLEEKGLSDLGGYAPVIEEKEVIAQSPEEVAKRAIALFTLALRAEIAGKEQGYKDNNEKPTEAVRIKQSELKKELAISELKNSSPRTLASLYPEEREFLATIDTAANSQDIVDYTWRYESLNVLLWSLNIIDTLPHPSQQCDNVKDIVKTMLGYDEDTFIKKAKLRPMNELLDCLDLHYILSEVSNKNKNIDSVDVDVVRERYLAISWLLNFNTVFSEAIAA